MNLISPYMLFGLKLKMFVYLLKVMVVIVVIGPLVEPAPPVVPPVTGLSVTGLVGLMIIGTVPPPPVMGGMISVAPPLVCGGMMIVPPLVITGLTNVPVSGGPMIIGEDPPVMNDGLVEISGEFVRQQKRVFVVDL